MIALLLTVCCSAVLFVLFRVFKAYNIQLLQAIVVNYFVCVVMGMVSGGLAPVAAGYMGFKWLPFSFLLGAIFIIGFQLIAYTVQQNGVTVASVAGKTSLVLPVTAAFFLYADKVTWFKVIGVILALGAVALASFRSDGTAKKLGHKEMLLPVVVFLLSGTGEIILNFAQARYLHAHLHHLFTMLTFGVAGALGAFWLLYLRQPLQQKNIVAGIILGVPNYFSIYLFLQALTTSGWEASVLFPVINMATVVLSGIAARVLFKETLSVINLTGVALAIAAIGLMLASG